MVTHPAHGARDGTLVNALLAHAGALPGDPLRAGLVHRLDRDTSGLIARRQDGAGAAHARQRDAQALHRTRISRPRRGHPRARESGTIDGAIGRDPQQPLAVRDPSPTDKPAVTHYALRERLRGASELQFRLETGRTHQIRVHMAAFGHPVINDPLYGRRDRASTSTGQALHAWRLRLRHPRTGERLAFEAPPPPAYVRARDALRA